MREVITKEKISSGVFQDQMITFAVLREVERAEMLLILFDCVKLTKL